MKYILSFLLLLVGCVYIVAAPPRTEKLVVRTTIYCDHCRQCNTCGELLINRIYDEKGIRSIDLNEKSMTITVMYNPSRITPQKIREAISRLGYDADDIKAKPEGLEALDGCCKKK